MTENQPAEGGAAAFVRTASLDLGRCLNEAVEVYRKNFLTLLLAVVLFDVLMHALPREPDELNVGRMLAYTQHLYWKFLSPGGRAARIEALTKRNEGNTILISESTWRIVNDDFETTEWEPLEVKGKADKIVVHEVTGEK